jgi:hypothetical protein
MDMGHARAGADAAPLVNTTCPGVHPKIAEQPGQGGQRADISAGQPEHTYNR